ncbi:MAG: exonuclease domain-containing protein [Elusimicrobiota bacterium]
MNKLLKNTTFAVTDIETTGFYPHLGDKITEIAISKKINGREIESFSTLVNPQREIPPEVSSITGITNKMVKDAPLFKEIVAKIMNMFNGCVLVFHNAPFDLSFIVAQKRDLGLPVIDNPVIDTLILARKHFGFPSNRLGDLANYLNFPHINKHRAMGDVKVTSRILFYLIKELKKRKDIKTIDDLLRIQGGSIEIPRIEEIKLPQVLKKAFGSGYSIIIKYISEYGDKIEREVKPIEVTRFKGRNYLVIYCEEDTDRRTLKFDRILEMKLKD